MAQILVRLTVSNPQTIKLRFKYEYCVFCRNYTKERVAVIRDAESRSGINGPKRIKPLSELEKRIKGLITPQSVVGDSAVPELGVCKTQNL